MPNDEHDRCQPGEYGQVAMWPWDHLAIGYLVVSLYRRGRSNRPPGEAEALAVIVGSQFPDLVDKPLGWGTTILPSGHSLAHSLSVAISVSVLVVVVARRFNRADVGVSFALAYLLHLPADVVYPVVLGRSPNIAFLFWPFVDVPASQTGPLTGRTLELLLQFVRFLHTPRGLTFLFIEGLLLLFALVLWWQDGWPGLGVVRRVVDPRTVDTY